MNLAVHSFLYEPCCTQLSIWTLHAVQSLHAVQTLHACMYMVSRLSYPKLLECQLIDTDVLHSHAWSVVAIAHRLGCWLLHSLFFIHDIAIALLYHALESHSAIDTKQIIFLVRRCCFCVWEAACNITNMLYIASKASWMHTWYTELPSMSVHSFCR